MIHHHTKALDFETCRELASKCRSTIEMRRIDELAYRASIRYGWITGFIAEFGYVGNRPSSNDGITVDTKYTYEICKDIASRCKTLSEFRESCSRGFEIAEQNWWIDDFAFEYKYFENAKALIDGRIDRNTKYTYEACREIASTCTSRNELKHKNKSAYNAILKNGWMDEFAETFHYLTPEEAMERYLSKSAKYNPEYIRSVALKYKTYHFFATKHPYLCSIARQTGQINEFTWLKRNEESKDGVIDHVYVYEFDTTHTAYIGRTIRPKQRHQEHLESTDRVKKYADSIGVAVPQPKYLYEGLTVDAGRQMECDMIEKYRKDGWNVLNKMPGGSIGALVRSISNRRLLRMAKKYTSLRTLMKKAPKVYYHLIMREMLPQCTWIVDDIKHANPQVPPGHWNVYENCKAEAMKYTRLSDFRDNSRGAHSAAVKNGWLHTFDWLERKVDPDYDTCYAAAKECRTRTEFHIKHCTEYRVSEKNGWLDKWEWLSRKQKKPRYWDDYEKCLELAKQCKSRKEFDLRNRRAYMSSLEHGWIDNWDWLAVQNRSIWSDYETCKAEAMKYGSRDEFNKGCITAYRIALRRKWIDEWTWLGEGPKPAGYWDNYDNCRNEALKYSTLDEFKKGNKSAYNGALRNEWLASFDWLGRRVPAGYWDDFERCKQESMKYTGRFEFQKNSRGAYFAALNHGWLDSFTWLAPIRRPKGYWEVFENCKAEAAKYATRIEFKRGCSVAYRTACRNGWIDSLFLVK
jgi:hypothetical protein